MSGVRVKFVRGSSFTGDLVNALKTNSNGTALFKAQFGYFTAIVDDKKYNLSFTRIYLQVKEKKIEVTLEPIDDDIDMKVGANIRDPNNADLDFMMLIESDKGAKCKVSPINKYCAYAEHAGDVTNGIGSEYINIKRLSVAKYLTYIGRSADY